MSFKYKSFGARFEGSYDLGQINRIDQGFNSIGGILDEVNPDFIYCNDGGYYDAAIKFKKEVAPSAKLILNVLDIPSQYIGINFDLGKMYEQLKRADIITCISKFVQGQLLHYYSLESFVIGNPIKDVNCEQRKNGIKKYPQFKAMMVGRVNDKFKRGTLAIQSLIMAGFQENEVAICGSENPNWGTYLGIVDDERLNDLYNSTDFTMVCSFFGGLELPIIESMRCGSLPIVCSDLPTVSELCPRHWWNYPSPQCISLYMRKLIDNPEYLKSEQFQIMGYGKEFLKQSVAENIRNIYYLYV